MIMMMMMMIQRPIPFVDDDLYDSDPHLIMMMLPIDDAYAKYDAINDGS